MAPTRNAEPAILDVGTEVSARFNGAFCEAKIRSVIPDVRLKVRDPIAAEDFTVKLSHLMSDLKTLRIHGAANVQNPARGELTVAVTILQIIDYSTYMVDFPDGDEKKLKRSSLHPKSGKHFDQSISLDNMPLTQPEKLPSTSAGSSQASDSPSDTAEKPKKAKLKRNCSVISGEAEESDLESVRRATRSQKGATPTVHAQPVLTKIKTEPSERDTPTPSVRSEKDHPEPERPAAPKRGRPRKIVARVQDDKTSTTTTEASSSETSSQERKVLAKRTPTTKPIKQLSSALSSQAQDIHTEKPVKSTDNKTVNKLGIPQKKSEKPVTGEEKSTGLKKKEAVKPKAPLGKLDSTKKPEDVKKAAVVKLDKDSTNLTSLGKGHLAEGSKTSSTEVLESKQKEKVNVQSYPPGPKIAVFAADSLKERLVPSAKESSILPEIKVELSVADLERPEAEAAQEILAGPEVSWELASCAPPSEQHKEGHWDAEKKAVAQPQRLQEASKADKFPVRSIVCVPQTGRKKFKWTLGLVVHPECRKKGKIDVTREVLVRLFTNGNFVRVPKDQIRSFSESLYTASEEERVQKSHPDYALQYLRDQTLPPTWYATLFTPFDQHESSDDGGEADAATARDDADEESEATRFMIQFIRYRDESGQPYDSSATVNGVPVELYKLYREVHNSGGFNRCNQENRWSEICEELDLPVEGASALKTIYQTHLHGGFETIYRNLAPSISDIRLGRKRHQYTAQDSMSSVEVVRIPPHEPCNTISSANKDPQLPPVKRARGRPSNASVKMEAVTICEEIPETRDDQSVTSGSHGVVIKREMSEESQGSFSVSDASWTAARNKVAPDVPEIRDSSVLKPGAVVEVLYRNKKAKKVLAYNARIQDNVGDVAFYVHYDGWNKRYDEWVPLRAILKVVDLSETGAKQHLQNAAYQFRNRTKLRTREWDQWRLIIDRFLSADIVGSPPPTTSSDQASTRSGSEVHEEPTLTAETKHLVTRKRSISRGLEEEKELKKVEQSLLFIPQESSEKIETVEEAPTVVLPLKEENQDKKEELLIAVEPIVELPVLPEVTEEPVITSEVLEVMAVAEAGEPVFEPTKIIKPGEKKQKNPTPKRSTKDKASDVEGPKLEPPRDVVADTVPSSINNESVEREVLHVVKTDQEELCVVEDISLPKIDRELKAKTPEIEVATLEQDFTASDPSLSLANVPVTISSAEEPVLSVPPSAPKRGRPSNKSKQDRATALVDSTPAETLPPNKTPVKDFTPAMAAEVSPPRKKTRSKKVPDLAVIDIPVAEEAKLVSPLPLPPPAPVESVSDPLECQFADNLQMLAAVAVPSLAIPEIVRTETVRIPKAKLREKKVKVMKVAQEQPKGLVMTAPAFAEKHRAALERLGLPLDGSEGAGETCIEEDEFGTLTRIVVEGVDLTDPDLKPGPSLTGAARIEAFEQNLNDVLLVSQLLIHRLATGHHILQRYQSINAGSKRKSPAEADSFASEDDVGTASGSSGGRLRSGRSK